QKTAYEILACGVQTCALPIYCSGQTVLRANVQKTEGSSHLSQNYFRNFACRSGEIRNVNEANPVRFSSNQFIVAVTVELTSFNQIGRASCRGCVYLLLEYGSC